MLAAIAALAAGAAPAWAASPPGGVDYQQDRVVYGGNVTLGPNDSVGRDLVVIGGNVVDMGKVGRDLVVVGGNVDLTGSVGHDLTTVAGNVTMHGQASVGRDAVAAFGNIDVQEQSTVGRNASSFAGDVSVAPTASVGSNVVNGGSARFALPNAGMALVAFTAGQLMPALAFLLLAVLLLVLFPRQLRTAGDLVEGQPAASFGLGCLGVVVGAVLAVLLGITVILLPISALIGLGMGAAWAFGWAAVLLVVGRRILEAGRSTEARLLPALLLGGGILALVWLIPVVNVIVGLVGGCFALGATLGSRFGTRHPGLPILGRTFPPPTPTFPPAQDIAPGAPRPPFSPGPPPPTAGARPG